MSFRNFNVPYAVDEQYSKKVAYFSMEFAVHQPLKIYSGGLGFLAGSHLRPVVRPWSLTGARARAFRRVATSPRGRVPRGPAAAPGRRFVNADPSRARAAA